MATRVAGFSIAVIGLVGVMLSAGGCGVSSRVERPKKTADSKPVLSQVERKTRLIAAENIELKKELQRRDAEIEKLGQLHRKELERQQKLLADCKQRNDALDKELKTGLEQRVNSLTSTVMDENAKLREELNSLKTELARLKEQTQVKSRPVEGR